MVNPIPIGGAGGGGAPCYRNRSSCSPVEFSFSFGGFRNHVSDE
jgi:hypothetical protein